MAKFDGDSQSVMTLAEFEARRFNHEYIGTEHILLALLEEESGFTGGVLKNLGLEPDSLVDEIERIIQIGLVPVAAARLPSTPPLKRAVAHAVEEMRRYNHQRVGAPHVLLGLIRNPECVASQLLVNQGVTLDVIRSEVLRQLDEKPPV